MFKIIGELIINLIADNQKFMLLDNPRDSLHKAMLYRLLMVILDEKTLAEQLYFKGGTAAALLGWLDRFSIDLDFDGARGMDKQKIRTIVQKVVASSGFSIKEQAKRELYFVLQYPAPKLARNTLKLSIIDHVVKANIYQPYFLADINRYAICQSKETMFANKLVAVTDRYQKYRTVAGRDIYDIHHFFTKGFGYNEAVITERTGLAADVYIRKLAKFIQEKVTCGNCSRKNKHK